MKLDHPTRVTIAVLLILLSSLISTARLVRYKAGFSSEQIGRDPISLYEKRFDGIKKDLPTSGTIGYITDKRYKNIGLDKNAAADYYLTRYTLSPVLVTHSVKYPFVIGNFRDTSAGLKTTAEAGITLIKDYGNGLMLFKGKAK